MLNINITHDLKPEVRTVLTEFRRVQVSRFPINVEGDEDASHRIKFVDSRFPSKGWRREYNLAILDFYERDDKGRTIYKLTSRLIQNEKYAAHNDDYFTRSTTDPKKLLKYVREYVKPYTALEIATRTRINAKEHHERWVDEVWHEFRRIASGISSSDIAKEVMYLKSRGVEFHTDKFRRVAEEGVELYAESARRNSKPFSDVHVFFNPDESVMVSSLSDGAMDLGTSTYETFEEVPPAIQQQVAMLRLMEPNTFVPEVGMRTSERDFWVEIEPNKNNSSNP